MGECGDSEYLLVFKNKKYNNRELVIAELQDEVGRDYLLRIQDNSNFECLDYYPTKEQVKKLILKLTEIFRIKREILEELKKDGK